MPNCSSTGKSRGYAGSPPWHTVAKPGVTVSPPWTQLMPVCYGFARGSYGGETVDVGGATVMPRNKPALFRSPVSPACFKKKWNHRGHFPVHTGSTRCIPIQCGACRRRYDVVPVRPGVPTVATSGLISGTVWTRLNTSSIAIWMITYTWYIFCIINKYIMKINTL